MISDGFVPVGFDPPTTLAADQFRLEPLGPQHNQADHAAWMSSIEHIRDLRTTARPFGPLGGGREALLRNSTAPLLTAMRHARHSAGTTPRRDDAPTPLRGSPHPLHLGRACMAPGRLRIYAQSATIEDRSSCGRTQRSPDNRFLVIRVTPCRAVRVTFG